MTPKQAWNLLDLEPSDDRRAVKRAYAVKLKAIDPDTDPKAFQALREALQIAQWEAQYGGQLQALENEEGWPEPSQDGDFEVTPDLLMGADDAHGEPDWEAEANEEHEISLTGPQQVISQLLWSENDSLTDSESVTLLQATKSLLADERMEQVGFASEIEEWLSYMLVNSIPKSDAAIPIAASHFGWDKQADKIGLPYAVQYVAGRNADLQARRRLEDPGHRWHAAWNRLRQPVSTKLSGFERMRHKADLTELLDSIRYHFPTLEWELNKDQVALCDEVANQPVEEKASRMRWWNWLILGWFVLQVLSFAFKGDGSGSSSAPLPASSPPAISMDSPEFIQWRDVQIPKVREWIEANPQEMAIALENRAALGEGLPNCAALDTIMKLTAEEYDQCYEREYRRANQSMNNAPAPPNFVLPDQPKPTPTGQQTTTRMIYSSPLWRSEQLPRVQRWMDEHKDEVDQLLQPHVKSGGLPDCARLAAAAGMSAFEVGHCRAGQRKRNEARQSAPPEHLPASASPHQTSANDKPPPSKTEDVCAQADLANGPLCKKLSIDDGVEPQPLADPAP